MRKRAVCILLVLILLAAVFSGCANKEKEQENISTQTAQKEENTAEKETAKGPETEETDGPYPGELTSILLMGSMDGDFSDENIQNYALTHILITMDPEKRQLRFTTFPYNMKIKPVLPDGKEAEEKQLQFLYANYGGDVVAATLSSRFGIVIDGWVIMNKDGVLGVIDDENIHGLKIDIKDLTINDIAVMFEAAFSIVWDESLKIKEKGLQKLKGLQVLGYFIDTHKLGEGDNTIDEEEIFRQKHPAIIDALIVAVKASNIDEKKVVEIAKNSDDNFQTNIKERDWEKIAKMALACTASEQEYLHIPQKIEYEKDGWTMIYDEVKDVNAVIHFVAGE